MNKLCRRNSGSGAAPEIGCNALGRECGCKKNIIERLTLCQTSINFAQPSTGLNSVERTERRKQLFRLEKRHRGIWLDVAGERREEGVVSIAEIDATPTK